MFSGLRRYVNDSWSELKKVTWPTRDVVLRLTLIVIAVSVVVSIYIQALDGIFRAGLDQVLR